MLICKTSIQAQWYFQAGRLPSNARPVGKDTLQIDKAENENTGRYQCMGKDPLTQEYFYSESTLMVMGKVWQWVRHDNGYGMIMGTA